MAHRDKVEILVQTILTRIRTAAKDFLDFIHWITHLLRRRLNTAAMLSPTFSQPQEPSETTISPPASCPKTRELVQLKERIVLDPYSGRVDVICRNEAVIKGGTAAATYRVANRPACLSLVSPRVAYDLDDHALRISRRDDQIQLDWHFELAADVESWLEVRNVGDDPIQIEQLHVMLIDRDAGGWVHIGAAPRRWSVYQHGWGSWTPVFARHLSQSIHAVPDDEQYARVHLPHGRSGEIDAINSEWVTVLWGRGSRRRESGAGGLLLGFVTAADQLSELRVTASINTFDGLRATCYADGVTLNPGQSLCSERLMISMGDDPLHLLERWAERSAHVMNARPMQRPPTGWCSWYYFFGENGETEIAENLAEIGRQSLPLDYVLIDDGYQRAIGDWLALDPDKFADMGELVKKIRDAGRRAGIWLAPFGLDSQSDTYQKHPDWVVRSEQGEPVLAWQHFGQDIYALDLSHPDVGEWLAGVFRTMRHEWGIDLFKIDFIFSACAPGKRYDSNCTRAQALRRGLEIIRSAIGDDAFLLGCGAPQMPCVGLVDGMRVGPDVAGNWHPFWPDLSMPSAENAMRNAVNRYFTHGRLWVNDPDCVLVRDKDDQSDLVLNEMRSLVSIIGLLGGMTFSSDNLPSLRKGRFKYLEQMFPPTNLSARPLDLFDNELPECLVLQVAQPWGEWLVVGIVNWQDRTMATDVDLNALGLPAGRYHVFNYWPRRYMGMTEGTITLDRHLPHETVVLLIKPAGNAPELLTTTFHVAQTLSEITSLEQTHSDDGSVLLKVGVERAGDQFGELWFTFPPTLKLETATVNGRKRKVSSDGVGVFHLGLSPNGSAAISLRFVPVD